MASYTYRCAAHGNIVATVDTDAREVHIQARGPVDGSCCLPRLAYLACSDAPGGEDRPDAPADAAAALASRPGSPFSTCEVTRT